MGESLLGGVPLRSMPACCTPLCWVVRAAEPFLDASLKSIQSMGVELQLITCHPALARVILHKGVWQACMHITLLCSWLHRWHLWGVYDVHPVASHDIQSGIHTLQAARSPSHALTRRSLACRHVETILCSRLRKGPVLDPYKRCAGLRGPASGPGPSKGCSGHYSAARSARYCGTPCITVFQSQSMLQLC